MPILLIGFDPGLVSWTHQIGE